MSLRRAVDESAIYAIERPHARLMRYYVLASLATGPAFPFVLIYSYFRYHTMRYRFDAQGVSMSWGILFRRETNLTYARIQDIHLASNLVERWLGLARIQVQTASGSAQAEMTIEGVLEYEALRDFLYSKMRGTKLHPSETPVLAGATEPSDDLAALLREIAVEVRGLRTAIEARHGDR
jgi:uncharacterized membrane protein YdbT with pleckstrin-like domain